MRTAESDRTQPALRIAARATDGDIRRCAQVVFDHFGAAANLYALVKLREAEREGNTPAVAVWVRIAGVIASFEGMEASTAIH